MAKSGGVSVVLARGFGPQASGEPKAHLLTDEDAAVSDPSPEARIGAGNVQILLM